MKIAVVAPSCTLKRETAERVAAIAARRGDCELIFHPQCFLASGHFAGSDGERLAALREAMADPTVGAVWFARGGYGANRIAQAAAYDLPPAARAKTYMGYSDAGFLLAAFDRAGLDVAHGPMPTDLARPAGAAAIERALDWLVRRDRDALEPALAGSAAAFNLSVLATMVGTALEPRLEGRELLIEEVGEHHYRIDRMMFQLVGSAAVRGVTRIRLGRCSDIPDNNPDFGEDAEAIVGNWCRRAGIDFGGSADIGHDAANRVVPF